MFDRDVVDLSMRRVMELRHRAVPREQMRRCEGYMAEITPLTHTTFWRGAYDDNAALRAEFFDMCGVRQ